MPGIITSRVMATGRNWRARRSPSSPPAAVRTQKPFLAQEALHQVALRRVVVDDQHAAPGGRQLRRRRRPPQRNDGDSASTASRRLQVFGSLTTAGSLMVKTLPSPGHAVHGHVAAHHLAEAAREGQTQAGAAELARGRGIGLRESPEIA